jgi:hypothetical protein
MKPVIILLISIFTLSVTAQAQQEYIWHSYGIGFSLADDFYEVTNNEEEFSAEGDGMAITIIPFYDESIDHNDITALTVAIAETLDLEYVDDVSLISINGFNGGYVEGVLDDVKIFLMGLIDPKTNANFFVIISFLDGDYLATDEAINICKGIYKL